MTSSIPITLPLISPTVKSIPGIYSPLNDLNIYFLKILISVFFLIKFIPTLDPH